MLQPGGKLDTLGLLTPTGGCTQAYAASEKLPAQQTPYGAGQWYLADGWFFSPTGWASFALSVSWFNPTGTYISTTSGAVTSLAASTWTHVCFSARHRRVGGMPPRCLDCTGVVRMIIL